MILLPLFYKRICDVRVEEFAETVAPLLGNPNHLFEEIINE
jgi:hypothetical protein